MSKAGETFELEKWNAYLQELYNWISEKYELLVSNEITNQDYAEHLEYYNREKERTENKIKAHMSPPEVNTAPPVTISEQLPAAERVKLGQEDFEKFFGVKINGDNTKPPSNDQVDNNQVIQQIQSTPDSKPAIETAVEENIEETKTVSANILLIGDSSVGRTSLRRAWMGKHFIQNHLTTVGASIEKKTIEIDGWTYNITITDLGGQDFYKELRRNFYRNIDGAIIAFDLTSTDSFRRIDHWVKEFYRESKKLVPFILVGNKYDLPNRVVTSDKGSLVAEKFSQSTMPNFKVRYLETSAKNGKNVNEVFEMICREIRSFKIQKRRKSQR